MAGLRRAEAVAARGLMRSRKVDKWQGPSSRDQRGLVLMGAGVGGGNGCVYACVSAVCLYDFKGTYGLVAEGGGGGGEGADALVAAGRVEAAGAAVVVLRGQDRDGRRRLRRAQLRRAEPGAAERGGDGGGRGAAVDCCLGWSGF